MTTDIGPGWPDNWPIDFNVWEDVRGLIAFAQAIDDGVVVGTDEHNAQWFRDLARTIARMLPEPEDCLGLTNSHDAYRARDALVARYGPDWRKA